MWLADSHLKLGGGVCGWQIATGNGDEGSWNCLATGWPQKVGNLCGCRIATGRERSIVWLEAIHRK